MHEHLTMYALKSIMRFKGMRPLNIIRTKMNFNPLKILKDAIRAVPAVKYALGVAGIISVIAIVAALKIDFRIAVFGTIIMLVLMVVLIIFAKLSEAPKKYFTIPIIIFMWFALFLTMITAIFLFTSIFLKYPLNLQYLILQESEIQEHKKSPIILSGTVKDENNQPIKGASVTIDGYDVEFKSKSDGSFVGSSVELSPQNVVTLRVYHEDYKSVSIDRKIESHNEAFQIIMKKLNQ